MIAIPINLQILNALHAQPTGKLIPLHGMATATFTCPSPHQPLPVRFDQWLTAAERLPWFHWEPDGAWSACSPHGADHWQLGGTAIERENRLWWLDAVGTSPREILEVLLSTCGWPTDPLLLHLNTLGVTIHARDMDHLWPEE
ncbi:MAG: hypothetical protein KatS3mg111_2001 [Pirellulaceae bacterium]|nr:MAG: hypothetical protein KatS3mg111_2001 [Pirellulaceae bacterium]